MRRAGFFALAVFAASMVLLACAAKPPKTLAKRGLPAKERHGFIIQDGMRTPLQIRQAFEAGYVVPGMDREFVFQLYGRPDKGFDTDSWEYLDEKGQLITGLTFKEDKVESISGDPNGGAPPRTAGAAE